MKKKSSRSGSGEKSRPEKSAQEDTAAGGGSSTETNAASDDSGKTAGKKSLPAFGFAADLLKETSLKKTSDDAADGAAAGNPTGAEAKVALEQSISEPGKDAAATSFGPGLASGCP